MSGVLLGALSLVVMRALVGFHAPFPLMAVVLALAGSFVIALVGGYVGEVLHNLRFRTAMGEEPGLYTPVEKPGDRATGQEAAWVSFTRSTVSLTSSGTRRRYVTRTRRRTRILPSLPTSPSTRAVRSSGLTMISRAASAPARVPVSQPPAAATR